LSDKFGLVYITGDSNGVFTGVGEAAMPSNGGMATIFLQIFSCYTNTLVIYNMVPSAIEEKTQKRSPGFWATKLATLVAKLTRCIRYWVRVPD